MANVNLDELAVKLDNSIGEEYFNELDLELEDLDEVERRPRQALLKGMKLLGSAVLQTFREGVRDHIAGLKVDAILMMRPGLKTPEKAEKFRKQALKDVGSWIKQQQDKKVALVKEIEKAPNSVEVELLSNELGKLYSELLKKVSGLKIVEPRHYEFLTLARKEVVNLMSRFRNEQEDRKNITQKIINQFNPIWRKMETWVNKAKAKDFLKVNAKITDPKIVVQKIKQTQSDLVKYGGDVFDKLLDYFNLVNSGARVEKIEQEGIRLKNRLLRLQKYVEKNPYLIKFVKPFSGWVKRVNTTIDSFVKKSAKRF